MTTFVELQRQAAAIRQRLIEYSGLPQDIVENVMHYAKTLTKTPEANEIDDVSFKAQMVEQFDITSQFMLSQMVDSLKRRQKTFLGGTDSSAEVMIPIEDFCQVICMFLSPNLDIQIDWVFGCYDTNNDGVLNRIEMYILLKPCILETEDMDTDEAVKDLMDMVLTVVDINQNGLIDLEEFRILVKRNILYIDLFGQVLPREHVVKRFLHKLKNKTPQQVTRLFQQERARSLTEPPIPKPPSLYPIELDFP